MHTHSLLITCLLFFLVLQAEHNLSSQKEIGPFVTTESPCAFKEKSDDAQSHCLLANTYKNSDNIGQAIEEFRIAYSLNPKDTHIMLELANLLTMRGQLDEALELYQKILVLQPTATTALYNCAFVLKRKGYINLALELLKTIVKKNPDHTQAQFSLGCTLLYKGDFEQGWKEHDLYLRSTHRYTPALKEWIKKGSLHGKKILIRHEGGLGDSIQFIRYVQQLKFMGAFTIVACPQPLLKLYQTSPGIDLLIDAKDSARITSLTFDAHSGVMTLAALFNSNEDTIPRSIPYIFPDPTLSAYWKSFLQKDNNFKIGICWQAGHNDQANHDISSRSIPFETIAHIGTIPGITLYVLQKDASAEQFKKLIGKFNITFFDQDFDNSHGGFMDTAAVINQLDLVISVDTAIAHLAGALGRPVWLLLNYAPVDWRWIHMRTDSPWYPTLRVFQQPAPFDWNSVIKNVIKELSIIVTK